MPYFSPAKLSRRATNYLLLGLSLPSVVDLNSSTAHDLLRSLNLLLSEFDSFQQLHGEDAPGGKGGAASSLSRARLPTMFRRPGKARRSVSGAAYAPGGAALGGGGGGGVTAAAYSAGGLGSFDGGIGSPMDEGGAGGGATSSGVPAGGDADLLLPGEEYAYLLTPALPFDPDFYETFATLCDVLIDVYTRVLALLPTPERCTAAVAELFNKADGKLRKIVVQPTVGAFDEAARAATKVEVASVAKVVLGGLM
jgi:hypothetical protein